MTTVACSTICRVSSTVRDRYGKPYPAMLPSFPTTPYIVVSNKDQFRVNICLTTRTRCRDLSIVEITNLNNSCCTFCYFLLPIFLFFFVFSAESNISVGRLINYRFPNLVRVAGRGRFAKFEFPRETGELVLYRHCSRIVYQIVTPLGILGFDLSFAVTRGYEYDRYKSWLDTWNIYQFVVDIYPILR